MADVGPNAELEANIVEVTTRAGLRRDPFAERRFHMTSSCGVCGKGALEQVRLEVPARPPAPVRVEPAQVLDLPGRARPAQDAFDRTGGIHATALFTAGGRAAGAARGRGPPQRDGQGHRRAGAGAGGAPTGALACLSGRIGFELVQKAVMGGLSGIVAVGAPTSLAVELAQEHGLLVCGFVRDGTFNVYSGAEQVAGAPRA